MLIDGKSTNHPNEVIFLKVISETTEAISFFKLNDEIGNSGEEHTETFHACSDTKVNILSVITNRKSNENEKDKFYGRPSQS